MVNICKSLINVGIGNRWNEAFTPRPKGTRETFYLTLGMHEYKTRTAERRDLIQSCHDTLNKVSPITRQQQ